MPGYLMPDDLKGYLTEKEGSYRLVNDALLASEGTLVAQIDKRTGETDTFRIPTLVPSSREDGSCTHYKEGKCDVHKDSPTGCKMFNACASGKKADKQEQVAMQIQQELLGVWLRYTEGKPTDEERMYCTTWHYLWQIGKRRENATELTMKYQEGVR